MSVQFIEPDFSKYPQHKRNSLSVGNANRPVDSVDSVDNDNDNDSDKAELSSNNPDASPKPKPLDIPQDKSPFNRRVSFDTIANSSAEAASPASFIRTNFISSYASSNQKVKEYSSFFLAATHCDFQLSYGSRTFLCSMTSKSYSECALIWLMDTLMHDNDELVLLRLYHENTVEYHNASSYQKQAKELHHKAVQLAQERNLKCTIQLELGVGKIKTVVHKMLALHQPSMVIVGSSAKVTSNYRRMKYKKNISSYLIAKSPVPVVVVTPKTAQPAVLLQESESSSTSQPPKNNNEYFASLMELTAALSDSESDNDERLLKPTTTNNTTGTGGTSACSDFSSDDDDDDGDDDEDIEEDDEDSSSSGDDDEFSKPGGSRTRTRRKSSDTEINNYNDPSPNTPITSSTSKPCRSTIKSAWKFFTRSSNKLKRTWSLGSNTK